MFAIKIKSCYIYFHNRRVEMNIDILIRTNRKSISISISPQGELIIKAPRRCSLEYIQTVIAKKEDWINLHRQRVLENQNLNKSIFNHEDILFCGQVYHVVFDNKIKHITLENEYCIVPQKYSDDLEKNLIKWYKKVAAPILRGRVEYFSNLMQLSPNKVRLSNARGCWGSCNSLGLVSLNWRLIMVPHDLIDYVVVHELAHLVQMNHSQLFWGVVKSVLPDFAVRRKALKKGDYLLSLYRNN